MANGTRKKLWHSMTVVGAMLMGALGGAQAVGVVPPESQSAAVGVIDAVSKLLIVLGIRRAVNDNIEGL